MAANAHVDYLLHLADNALVLGQRNAEWCGHGPVLEEDIAQANISLDLIGQARLLYQHAAALQGEGATEDALAYFRDAGQFRNYTLLELPHHGALAATAAAERDYATTIARNFLYSAWMVLLWEALQQSSDVQLAGIAGRALKETRYHLRHSRDWLVRLGDGTDESHRRMQAAMDHLLPFTQEFWLDSATDAAACAARVTVPASSLKARWEAEVADALEEATLTPAPAAGHVPRGKLGLHSEHLGFLLAEMQSLARQHPGGHLVMQAAPGMAPTIAPAVPSPPGGWQADDVRALLAAIPDPEIPVVGIAELGMLREVLPDGLGGFEVIITPTYSGCPAMEQISDDIRATLAQQGIRARITTRLAPAWSTDWLTEAAREKLRAYGIAAPGTCGQPAAAGQTLQFARGAARRPTEVVPCPRCASVNTTPTSHFGSTACKALYRCLDCLEPFDYFKPY